MQQLFQVYAKHTSFFTAHNTIYDKIPSFH